MKLCVQEFVVSRELTALVQNCDVSWVQKFVIILETIMTHYYSLLLSSDITTALTFHIKQLYNID